MTTLLIGEQYMDFEDPQKNSYVQRSWIYGCDPTIKRVEEKLNNTLRQLGGKASRATIMNTMARERVNGNRIIDMNNSLPLEGKIQQICCLI